MAIPAPSPLAIGNVVKAVIKGVAFGQQVINTMYFGCRADPDPGATVPKIADLGVKLRDKWRAGPLVQLNVEYVVQEYLLYNMDGVTRTGVSPDFVYHQQLIDGSIVLGDDDDDRGTVETDSETLLDAMTVRFIPASLGRNTRRSMRFGPMNKADEEEDGQTWTDNCVARWVGAMIQTNWILTDAAWTVEFYPITFSTALAVALGNPAPGRDFSTVISTVVQTQARKLVRSQVSRKPSNSGY